MSTIVDPELLKARQMPKAVPNLFWLATNKGIHICNGILLLTPAKLLNMRDTSGCTFDQPNSEQAMIHKTGANATK